ncbi:proteasome subunit alpha type-2-like [Drosophila obscura]|uniref:proteasome subunit alpha type-2-like n=1 Tax=Drosophila obscura TaxID=7282 RepID=UPI001BB22A32|nr:proteasome subunit alpha type-2-like [Drosophila obscura]
MDEEFKFSPSFYDATGIVGQSLCALRAASKGSTSVGIVAPDCVVIATATRKSSVLMEPRRVPHVAPIDLMTGMTYSGLSGDFRTLKKHAQKCSNNNNLSNGLAAEVSHMAHSMAIVMQEYTQISSARPFGVSLLIAGCDRGGVPHLYNCSATGSHFPRKAIALGRNADICTNFLEQRCSENLRVEDAISTALLALKTGYEKKQPEGDEKGGAEEERPMPTDVIEIGIAYPEGFECLDFRHVDEFYADLAR